MEPKHSATARPDSYEALESLESWNGDLDPSEWELETLLNAPVLQSLMEDYAKITFTVTAILDLKGKVLVAVGWQDLCTRFHRAHPISCLNCTESDLFLAGNVVRGRYLAYKCKSGLWDVVTPLYIANTHMGNIYTGQFFYDDETVDRQFFEAQAEAYGYDKTAYLEALDRVPRFSRDQVKRLMDFLVKFTDLVSKFTLGNLRSVAFIREQARSAAALRESEAALRESQAMLALVLDTIPQAVFWKDLQGRYLGCNKPFAAAAGLRDPSQVIGKTDYELPWSPEEAEGYRADDRRVLESRQPKLHILESQHQADGSYRQIETSKAPLFKGNGEPFAVLGIFRDVTEAKRGEEEREKLRLQLQQAQKMESLGNLAGGVAHDMNNVLGAILGLASANIAAHSPETPQRHAFETIIKATERGSKMVKSLLRFARQSTAEDRQLDLNRILLEEMNILERTTLAKVRIEMALADDLRPIRGDEGALAHAIMNLCVNAVDAMAEQGTLTLRTFNQDSQWVEVQVQDTGIGMSREILDRAMDPFFTTKGIGKGTGLGLAMVYSTVKAHHGEVEIQSEPGHGTTVSMRFPACAPMEAPEGKGEPAHSSPALQGLEVLVIDDDDLMQISTGMLLQSLGCRVIPVESGEKALALLEAGLRMDVVIMDMNMPGIGGLGTLPRLRVTNPDLPVLVATGYVEHGTLDLVATYQKTTLLVKPFTREELGAKLEAAIGRGESAQRGPR